jgi:riboflavin synthase alpha subunit
MFTGIVTHRGRIEGVTDHPEVEGVKRVVLHVAPALPRADEGDSVAIDGCCLTVVHGEPTADGARYTFEAVPETLRLTTLGERRAGDEVNVEGPLRMGDPFGGHFVQGHVHGVGEIVRIGAGTAPADSAWAAGDVRIEIRAPQHIFALLQPKGSVTVDGCSLTVGEVEADPAGGGRFSIYLIPHTLAVTGFGTAQVGQRVNLEPDMLSAMVASQVRNALEQERRADR